jgi:antagonist of KipI
MSLTIIKPGISDSLQDEGRTGFANIGVNPGGMMDRFAGRVANLLVGNTPNTPVLEMHFPGPQILFEQNALISLTGGNFSPTIDGEPIDLWQPIVVRRNTVLQFHSAQWGAWCYLAVHGGFVAEEWMGGKGTHLKAGAGGWQGRSLRKADELTIAEMNIYFPALLNEGQSFHALPWKADTRGVYDNREEILVIEAPEWDTLNMASKLTLMNSRFGVLPSSDRMGYQLIGEALLQSEHLEMVSSAVTFGTVQLLPSGQLIVLTADHQTTGGYPRVAQVISADLPRLVQKRTGDQIRFRHTDIAQAEEQYFERQQHLQTMQQGCLDRLNDMICLTST